MNYVVAIFIFIFLINVVFVCLDDISHSGMEGRKECVTHAQGARHITQENYS